MDGWARVKQAMVEGLRFWDGLKQAATATWLKLWAVVQQAATAQWPRFRDSVQQAATATWLKLWAGLKQAAATWLKLWTGVPQAATAQWPRFRDSVQQATAIWLRVWDGLKQEWLRILAGLFMAVVIVAACYWTWIAWHSWRIADLASVTTTWPNSRILNDVLVEIKTKCSDSVLSYDVVIVPPKSNAALTLTEKIETAKMMTDSLRERLKTIHVQLIDKDGFPTAAYDVAIDEFVRIYSSNEERLTSLEAWGTLACSPASYVRAEALIVSWTERP
jgi:hypothetical protein